MRTTSDYECTSFLVIRGFGSLRARGSGWARISPNMVARSLQIVPDRKHGFSGSGDVQPVSPPHFEAKNPKDIGFFVCTKMFQKRQGQKLLFSIILGFFRLFNVNSRLSLVPNCVPGDQSLVIFWIKVAPGFLESFVRGFLEKIRKHKK